MIFSWFNATEAKKFGLEIADFYINQIKKSHNQKNEKFIERKQRELLSKISKKISIFNIDHKLNIYKKAQLSNAFKWRLLDSGFDKIYADELTSWITRQL